MRSAKSSWLIEAGVVLLAVGVVAGYALNFRSSAMLFSLGVLGGLSGIVLLVLAALQIRHSSPERRPPER